MCGIVGVIDKRDGVSREILGTLRATMAARGPDGVGEFLERNVGMGMCRLAVIDTAHGWQPMTSLGGDVVVFQNGEIYNYKVLRKNLEEIGFHFETHSDTEVLAHGYACWGIEELLDRVDGMYAIAIFDKRTNELHLARDRFGEKPLFYSCESDRFAYASNVLALAGLPWVDTSVDVIALDRYLALHFVPGDRTILKGIRRILPGDRLCISIEHMVPRRHSYYRLSLGEPNIRGDTLLEECVEQAVTSRLVADVPVGVFLSGGIDSSLVAAIAARHSPGIATFSMGFPSSEHDERKHAELVAKHIGSNHRSFIFDQDDFDTLLAEVVEVLDEPLGDQAVLPVYWLSREARGHVTVVLSGEGADEIFGGYDYYRQFLSGNGKTSSLAGILSRLIDNPLPLSPSGFPLLTSLEERERLMDQSLLSFDRWEREFIDILDGASCPVQRAGAADLCSWLADDLLVKLDRMTMAHSLEGRAPYLHPGVVESAFRLLASERINEVTTKVALRRVAQHWLPEDILQRPKQGFVLPMRRWLRKWLKKRGGSQSYFLENQFPGLNMKNTAEAIGKKFDERLTFALIMLLEWQQSFKRRVEELRAQVCELSGTSISVYAETLGTVGATETRVDISEAHEIRFEPMLSEENLGRREQRKEEAFASSAETVDKGINYEKESQDLSSDLAYFPVINGRSLLTLLACPNCSGEVCPHMNGTLRCLGCNMSYPVRHGVPIFLLKKEHYIDRTMQTEKTNPYSGAALEIILKNRSGVVLDIGAGHPSDEELFPNVVRQEIIHYASTSVVSNTVRLPFRDSCFDALISESVLEHVIDPHGLAEEIYRVLKPGGVIRVDSAFLQPFHGDPNHYFNMTVPGIERVFQRFRKIRSGVDEHQKTAYSIRILLRQYREFVKSPKFKKQIDDVLAVPWEEADKELTQEQHQVTGAGVFFEGIKE
jgi:asparagine synthase (glutamine-hydrolysing)